MFEFRRKIIDFGVLFAALTFGVSKFRCSHFDENSSILACFLPHLPSACRNFDARISTKNHRFWRAFCRTYRRRVEIPMSNFDEKSSILACFLTHLPWACRNFDARISMKNHRFCRAFCRSYLRRVEIPMLAFRRKIIVFGVLFAALTSGVSKFRCSFSTILDTFRHLFLSGSRYVDGDFFVENR